MLVGYARQSSHDQKTGAQLDALRKAGCKLIFEESCSGAGRGRPKLNLALNFLQTGDTLVIWKFSQLASTMPQLLNTAALMEERGIGLKILAQDIDTTRPDGRMVFTLFSAIAEFRHEKSLERTPPGLGIPLKPGRPGAPTEKDLKLARALLEKPGTSIEDVASKLGIRLSTVNRYLGSPRSVAQEASRTRTTEQDR